MIIELGHYLILSSMLFTIGVVGVFLNRKCNYNFNVTRANFAEHKY